MRRAPAAGPREERVVLFGDPVAQSLSPAFQNAGFAALGLPLRYTTRRLPAAALARALRAAEAEPACRGLNLTIPHKEAAFALLGHVTPRARRTGAVNTVWREGGAFWGDDTDGPGLMAALAELGFAPAGARVALLGAGGAARGVVGALAEAGASVLVLNRTVARAAALATAFGGAVRAVAGAAELPAHVDLVVQATSLGLGAAPETPAWGAAAAAVAALPWDRWAACPPLAVDLVYRPLETPFLAAARAAGCRCQTGLSMLLHQGLLGFERWTGARAPQAVMRRALWAAAGAAEPATPDALGGANPTT